MQERMNGSTNWAPVYELGKSEEGAYFVSDYFDSSAQKVLNGRAQMTGSKLSAIVTAILNGLWELKKRLNRSHGNLTPSNILISGRVNLENARIVLADANAQPKLQGEQGEDADLQALGELICRLVYQRPTGAPGALPPFPLPDGPQWKELGDQADAWRRYCNLLRAPREPSQPLTLE